MIASHVFGGHYDRYDEEDEQPKFGTIARLMQNLRYFGAFYKSFDKKMIKLNLAGKSFQIHPEKIMERPGHSLLHRFAMSDYPTRMSMSDAYIEETNEYFFERSSASFDSIYRYYVSGVLHRPNRYCPHDFLHDLKFWQIPITSIQPCCRGEVQRLDNDYNEAELIRNPRLSDAFDTLWMGAYRRRVWNLIEVPESSFAARIFAILSISAVAASNLGLIVGSMKSFQIEKNITESDGNITREWEPHPTFEYVESVCIVWFTIEYVTKMCAAADFLSVFLQKLNLIDLMAILPFYFELSLLFMGISTESLRDLKMLFMVIRILRVLRVIRIFKLGRYSAGLQLFGLTLIASAKQLGMLSMVILTAVVFFSSILYFVENGYEGSQFTSIPVAFWWCIVTMTTVGYGDIVPISFWGKVVATGAIACGVLVLAVPITIIVDNFMRVTHDHRDENDENTGVSLALKMDAALVAANPELPESCDRSRKISRKKSRNGGAQPSMFESFFLKQFNNVKNSIKKEDDDDDDGDDDDDEDNEDEKTEWHRTDVSNSNHVGVNHIELANIHNSLDASNKCVNKSSSRQPLLSYSDTFTDAPILNDSVV